MSIANTYSTPPANLFVVNSVLRCSVIALDNKRHYEHLSYPLDFGMPELRKSDLHFLMSLRWLASVGSKQKIPPREIEAEIAVCLSAIDGMVHAMHVGSDENFANKLVEAARNTDVAVAEHRRSIQQNFEDQDCHR